MYEHLAMIDFIPLQRVPWRRQDDAPDGGQATAAVERSPSGGHHERDPQRQ
jgi:hypothetical protein